MKKLSLVLSFLIIIVYGMLFAGAIGNGTLELQHPGWKLLEHVGGLLVVSRLVLAMLLSSKLEKKVNELEQRLKDRCDPSLAAVPSR